MQAQILKSAAYLLLIFYLLSGGISPLKAASKYPFISENFDVPEKLETHNYRLRMLTINDVIKDYYDTIYSDKSIISLIFLYLLKGDNEAANKIYTSNLENFLYEDKKIEAKELIDYYHLPLSWFKNFSRLYL